MNLILHLDQAAETKLKEQAAREGKTPEIIALEAVLERLASLTAEAAPLALDARRAEFQAFLASDPDDNPLSDVSRESIYE